MKKIEKHPNRENMLKKIKSNSKDIVYLLKSNINEIAKRVNSINILTGERDQQIISLGNRILKNNNKELRNV